MKTLIAIALSAIALFGLNRMPLDGARTSAPAKPFSAAAASTSAETTSAATSDVQDAEAARAAEILAELSHTYRYLDGVTVRMGTTPAHEQAVAYYTLNEIVISPEHTATLEEILAHEVWHIIDWRSDGHLNWGENLPPTNTSEYELPT